MLKILDVLIGIATIMLLFSMPVTLITQFLTSVLQTRGRNLRDGLNALLRQLDPRLEKKVAEEIATAVLKHPLIASKAGALGTVVHREELTMLLMEVAAGQTMSSLGAEGKAALTA